MSLKIEVRHLVHGQPAPYADHTYRSELTFEAPLSWELPLKAQILALVRVLVHSFTDEEVANTPSSYFQPRLRELECVYAEQIQDPDDQDRVRNPQKTWSAGRRETWIVEIREPFCD